MCNIADFPKKKFLASPLRDVSVLGTLFQLPSGACACGVRAGARRASHVRHTAQRGARRALLSSVSAWFGRAVSSMSSGGGAPVRLARSRSGRLAPRSRAPFDCVVARRRWRLTAPATRRAGPAQVVKETASSWHPRAGPPPRKRRPAARLLAQRVRPARAWWVTWRRMSTSTAALRRRRLRRSRGASRHGPATRTRGPALRLPMHRAVFTPQSRLVTGAPGAPASLHAPRRRRSRPTSRLCASACAHCGCLSPTT